MQQAFGLNIPQTLDDVCDPTRLALVVYDMQVGIVKQIENGPQITEKVLQVLEAARKARIRIFFTRHMSLPKELMGVSQFRTAMAWQRVKSPDEVQPWFLRDAPGFHLIQEMNPLPSEAILDKIAMSAFEGTPLNIAIRDCGIDAFAIVGIAMEIGIERTVRQGSDLGYITVVFKDACGFGHRDAGARSVASLEFAGDELLKYLGAPYFDIEGRYHENINEKISKKESQEFLESRDRQRPLRHSPLSPPACNGLSFQTDMGRLRSSLAFVDAPGSRTAPPKPKS
jgi:nicotinamidase-related amidase